MHLLGRTGAKCPACGGERFSQVPVGPLTFKVMGQTIDLDWKASGVGYLCATIGCARPFTQEDVRAMDAERLARRKIIEGG
jgi:hypothetical protein